MGYQSRSEREGVRIQTRPTARVCATYASPLFSHQQNGNLLLPFYRCLISKAVMQKKWTAPILFLDNIPPLRGCFSVAFRQLWESFALLEDVANCYFQLAPTRHHCRVHRCEARSSNCNVCWKRLFGPAPIDLIAPIPLSLHPRCLTTDYWITSPETIQGAPFHACTT